MTKLSNNFLSSINKIVLFDIDYTLFNTDIFRESQFKKHFVYEEVCDVLSKLSKIATLGIFSEGETEFQINKIKKTRIKKYFSKNHIYIVGEKEIHLQEILIKYKDNRFFLVDDKLSILHKAKETFPYIFTIWIKRGKYAQNQKSIEGFIPDAIIESLKDIISVINNN